MRAYSLDLRKRVIADYDAGTRTQAIAEKYRVSTKWVRDLRRLREETGQIAPRQGKTGPKPKLAEHAEQLTELVQQNPDATLEELRQALPVAVSITTLWRVLRQLGVTFKKSTSCGRTRPARC
jgi:transposase